MQLIIVTKERDIVLEQAKALGSQLGQITEPVLSTMGQGGAATATTSAPSSANKPQVWLIAKDR